MALYVTRSSEANGWRPTIWMACSSGWTVHMMSNTTVSSNSTTTRSTRVDLYRRATMAQSELKGGFAARLRELCDENHMPERGRQSQLAREFSVSQGATRKWLTGESLPELEMVVRLSTYFKVNVNWLLQGVGLKRGTKIDMKAVVLDEALSSFPTDERREVLNYIKYKLVSAKARYTGEQLARYTVALDRMAAAAPTPAPPAPEGNESQPPKH